MAERRPYASLAEIAAAADDVWRALGTADWLEAFAAHPPIGAQRAAGGGACGHAEPGGEEPGAGRAGKAGGDAWSVAEQSGMDDAGDDVRQRLAEGNREYEARFGYIFIVCATGKPATELLAALERRLPNHPGEELRIAAEEQRKITRLRLDKLLT